jgi:hypothetical protein
MHIHVDWANNACNIVHLTFERGWTWDDLKQAIQKVDTLIESVEHTVHLIIDIRNGGIPSDFLAAAGDIFAQGEARANEGKRIVIGAGMLIRAAYHSLQAVYGSKLAERPFLFAGSMDEAHRLIATP